MYIMKLNQSLEDLLIEETLFDLFIEDDKLIKT